MKSRIWPIIFFCFIVIIFSSCKQTERIVDRESHPVLFTKSEVLYPKSVTGFSFNTEDSQVVLIQNDEVKIISISNGQSVFELHYSGQVLSGVGFTEESRQIVGGAGHDVYFWNLDVPGKSKHLNYTQITHKSAGGSPSDFAMHPAKAYAATAAIAAVGAMRVVLWNLQKQAIAQTFAAVPQNAAVNKHRYGAVAVTFNSDGSLMAFALQPENKIQLIQLPGDTVAHEFDLPAGTGQVNDLAFSPDGKYLATASVGYTKKQGYFFQPIQLWNVDDGKKVELLNQSSSTMQDASVTLAFSPRGTYLASGAVNGMIHIWNIEKRIWVQTLKGHKEQITDLEFSHDGRLLISSARGAAGVGSVRLWRRN